MIPEVKASDNLNNYLDVVRKLVKERYYKIKKCESVNKIYLDQHSKNRSLIGTKIDIEV